MIGNHFDHRKFVDRELEQKLFEDLLQFENDARILAICDQGGMGKSYLLEKFRHRCRTKDSQRIPISLIKLDQLPNDLPLALIKLIVEHLASFEIACPTFTSYDSARISGDFMSIRTSAYLQGKITLPGRAATAEQASREQMMVLRQFLTTYFNDSELRNLCSDLAIDYEGLSGYAKADKVRELVDYTKRHGRIGDLMARLRQLRPYANWQNMNLIIPPAANLDGDIMGQLLQEQQETAQEVCIHAFFDDLQEICAHRPVVLMFDAYEKCTERIKTWIEAAFLDRLFFNLARRPNRLILVVSGHEIPDFSLYWSIEDCNTLVRSVKELGKWKRDDVATCLDVHGYADYEEEDIDTFHRLIQMGIEPSTVVGLIQVAVTKRRRS